jgi:hypothetical protein
MNGQDRPRQHRQRRSRPACDGNGRRLSGLSARGGESSLSGRTTTRALIAVAAYVAQDLRDAEGLMRPVLRRAAIRLALSSREPARRLGGVYLRLDSPAPDADPRRSGVIEVGAAASGLAIAAAPEAHHLVSEGETSPC